VLLLNGRAVASGPVAEVFTDAALRATYGGARLGRHPLVPASDLAQTNA
jgi:ABC-type hemin transport system ATPase subunit